MAVLLLGLAHPHIAAEIILGTLLHRHAVPSLIAERIVAHHHAVAVPFSDGVVGGGADVAVGVPGGGGVPLPAVGGAVFEVSVLHHLGIESAIGCIADILEEDTDQFVADLLLLLAVDGHGHLCLLPVEERAEPLVVVEALLPGLLFLGPVGEMPRHPLHRLAVHLDEIAHRHLPVHEGRVAFGPLGEILARRHNPVGGEMTEVLVGYGRHHLALGSLVADEPSAVSLLEGHGRKTPPAAHARIVLGAPHHHIFRIGHTEAGSRLVHLKHSHIAALHLRDVGRIHVLLAAPGRVVRLEERTHLGPLAVFFLYRHLHAGLLVVAEQEELWLFLHHLLDSSSFLFCFLLFACPQGNGRYHGQRHRRHPKSIVPSFFH